MIITNPNPSCIQPNCRFWCINMGGNGSRVTWKGHVKVQVKLNQLVATVNNKQTKLWISQISKTDGDKNRWKSPRLRKKEGEYRWHTLREVSRKVNKRTFSGKLLCLCCHAVICESPRGQASLKPEQWKLNFKKNNNPAPGVWIILFQFSFIGNLEEWGHQRDNVQLPPGTYGGIWRHSKIISHLIWGDLQLELDFGVSLLSLGGSCYHNYVIITPEHLVMASGWAPRTQRRQGTEAIVRVRCMSYPLFARFTWLMHLCVGLFCLCVFERNT